MIDEEEEEEAAPAVGNSIQLLLGRHTHIQTDFVCVDYQSLLQFLVLDLSSARGFFQPSFSRCQDLGNSSSSLLQKSIVGGI